MAGSCARKILLFGATASPAFCSTLIRNRRSTATPPQSQGAPQNPPKSRLDSGKVGGEIRGPRFPKSALGNWSSKSLAVLGCRRQSGGAHVRSRGQKFQQSLLCILKDRLTPRATVCAATPCVERCRSTNS
eukprot:6474119-Amphidinium_carterae.2